MPPPRARARLGQPRPPRAVAERGNRQRAAATARGDGGHSPVNVTHYLKGIDFPARRADVLRHAKQNHAEKELLDGIAAMPDQQYANMADVTKGFGKSH